MALAVPLNWGCPYITSYNVCYTKLLRNRLDSIFVQFKKHKVDSVAELLEVQKSLGEQLMRISSFDESLEELNKKIIAAEKELKQAGDKLTESRKKVLSNIEKTIVGLV